MKLLELYQEEPGSSFTNDDVEYDLNKVLQDVDDYPKVMFFVKDLKWVLKYDKADPERIEKANLKTPILVTYFDEKFVVVDGLHRLTKAVQEKDKYIVGKVVPYDILDRDKVVETTPSPINSKSVLPSKPVDQPEVGSFQFNI